MKNPYAELVGFEYRVTGKGKCIATLEVGPHLHNPIGMLHGGALYAMADTSMAHALASTIDRGQTCATIEIKMVYLKPVIEGRVRCVSKIVHRGARIGVLESSLSCSRTLVAKALGTFVIFAARPGQAGGSAD